MPEFPFPSVPAGEHMVVTAILGKTGAQCSCGWSSPGGFAQANAAGAAHKAEAESGAA